MARIRRAAARIAASARAVGHADHVGELLEAIVGVIFVHRSARAPELRAGDAAAEAVVGVLETVDDVGGLP